MVTRRERQIGEAFTPTEQTLLELLCTGEGPRFVHAREQLAFASWGGYEYQECECFAIRLDPRHRPSPIEHDGGPFSSLDVVREGEGLGTVDLWVVDGVLHSVDYMPFVDDHTEFPDPALCSVTHEY